MNGVSMPYARRPIAALISLMSRKELALDNRSCSLIRATTIAISRPFMAVSCAGPWLERYPPAAPLAATTRRDGASARRHRQRIFPASFQLEASDQRLAQPVGSSAVSASRLSHRKPGGWRDKGGSLFLRSFCPGSLATRSLAAEILADAPHILIYPEVGMDPMSCSTRRTTAGSGSMQFLGPPRNQRLSNSRLLFE